MSGQIDPQVFTIAISRTRCRRGKSLALKVAGLLATCFLWLRLAALPAQRTNGSPIREVKSAPIRNVQVPGETGGECPRLCPFGGLESVLGWPSSEPQNIAHNPLAGIRLAPIHQQIPHARGVCRMIPLAGSPTLLERSEMTAQAWAARCQIECWVEWFRVQRYFQELEGWRTPCFKKKRWKYG